MEAEEKHCQFPAVVGTADQQVRNLAAFVGIGKLKRTLTVAV